MLLKFVPYLHLDARLSPLPKIHPDEALLEVLLTNLDSP